MLVCPNINSPEWKALEKSVGRFEAFKDFLEHDGEIRTPEEVKAKKQLTLFPVSGSEDSVGNREVEKLMRATDKLQLRKKAGLVRELRDIGFISKKSFTENNGFRYISVPKIHTEMDLSRGTTLDAIGLPRTKDINKWNKLDEFLALMESEGNDTEFITLHESKDAYYIKVPTDVYEASLGSPVAAYYRDMASTTDVAKDFIDPQELSEAELDRTASLREARVLAEQIANQLNVDYQFINSEEAIELTRFAENPWKGEKAFYFGDRVYFVGNNLTTGVIFHEFSHPFVRSIHINNTKLFDNLYNKLLDTQEGKQLVEEVKSIYKELSPDDTLFKEEVIVRSLEKAYAEKPQGAFAKFIKDLMYAIKQILRSAFGSKVDISKLDSDTTLNQLAKMLSSGEKFDLGDIEDSNVVAYAREQSEFIDDIMKISKPELQAMTTRAYDILLKHIDVVQSNKNYEEMANILTNEDNRGDLQEMKKNLDKYSGKLSSKLKDVRDDLEFHRNHSIAMVNTLFRLEKMVEKIYAHIDDIASNPDNIDNLHKAYYYDYLLKYWSQFVNEAKEAMDTEKIPASSPISQLINKIDRNLEKSRKVTQSIYSKGVRDAIYSELEPMAKSIEEKYNTIIDNLKKRGASPTIIDKWYKEYHGLTQAEHTRLKELQAGEKAGRLNTDLKKEYDTLKRQEFSGVNITPEKLESTLKGELGDANAFNAFFEGYMYSADPVIGGLALYVKNNMNEVIANGQGKFNDFAKDMVPLLKAAGYNPSNVSDLASKICNVDVVGTRDKEGNFTERKILSFMSPFKGYRLALDKARYDIEVAERKYSLTGTDDDKRLMIDAISAQKKLMRDYFHQQYKQEFYKRDELFEKDDIGKEAAYLRENLFERMRNLTEPLLTQKDELEMADELDALWSEYRQLHSRFDLHGNLKTGKDLDIADRLRQYREESRKFYEWKERKGAFLTALKSYEQELIDNKVDKDGDTFRLARQEWIDKNTRIVIKPSFYTKRQKILDRIADIMAKLPDADRKKVDVGKLWEDIIDITSSFRDEDGQPNAQDMSVESISKTKDVQEAIILAQEAFSGMNGLTKAEAEEMRELFSVIREKERKLTTEERDRLTSLMDKRDVQGLSQLNKDELFKLFEELDSMQRREATEYYADVVNNWLTTLDTTVVKKTLGSNMISKDTADLFLDDAVVNNLSSQSAEFEAWFQANHIRKKKWDAVAKKEVERWERLYIWSVIRPSDKEDLEGTDITDNEGNVVESINKVPTTKYFTRAVKKEWRTPKTVAETVDNRGAFLPRLDVQDSPFLNKEYENLKKSKPDLFKVLNKMTEHHLKNQEGLGYKSRLYLDVPRFRKNSLELVQTQQIKKTIQGAVEGRLPFLTILAKRIKLFWSRGKDAPESGFNYNDEFNLVRADMFDNEISSVPIAGLYDIDIDDVSTDLTQSLMRYMLSAERQKKLQSISPVAQALKSVVNDDKNQVKRLDAVNRFNFVNRGIVTYLSKKGRNTRKAAVNAFIEREFEGKTHTGMGGDVPWLNNTATLLFKRASFGFFALNIPSALKNTFGAKFQGMIEASAGKYMNHATFAQGELWAFNTMGQVSFEIYKKGPKSLNIQMLEIFDPIQGRFEDKFGESMSRTMASDTANLSWLYNFRKWTENQATVQAFAGMMYHQKVKQGDKLINYVDAWELRDEKIQLKEGVDPSWGITYDKDGNMHVGENFNMMKNRIQQVINNLNGAYAKFDQPEAQRYLAFRFLSFLRRYFTTMAVNRWGFQGGIGHARGRMNPGLGDISEGYYVSVIKTLGRAFTTQGQYLGYMTKDEKRAWMKFGTELASLLVISAIMVPFLGWDPDDKDKYEKLRKRSGAMPFFGLVPEDPEHPFNGFGYMENHMLSLAMQIRAENEQFIPWPNFGLDDYTSLLDVKSLAMGPTFEAYKKMFTAGLDQMMDDPSAYYKRSVGPYQWQQEGGAKLWNHTMKAVGMTGSSIDPVMAIKNFEGIKTRGK